MVTTLMVQVGYCYRLPAVHHNSLIASLPLDFGHLFNHISHSSQVRAATIRSPVGDMELAYLTSTVELQKGTFSVMVYLSAQALD